MSVEQRDALRERWDMHQQSLTLSALAGGGDTPAAPWPCVQGESRYLLHRLYPLLSRLIPFSVKTSTADIARAMK